MLPSQVSGAAVSRNMDEAIDYEIARCPVVIT